MVAAPALWLASAEWRRWWDPVAAEVVRELALADEDAVLTLVRTLPDGELIALQHGSEPVRARPGLALDVFAYSLPVDWDGARPLRRSELAFDSEPAAYARREDAPVKSAEQRERARKGWAW